MKPTKRSEAFKNAAAVKRYEQTHGGGTDYKEYEKAAAKVPLPKKSSKKQKSVLKKKEPTVSDYRKGLK